MNSGLEIYQNMLIVSEGSLEISFEAIVCCLERNVILFGALNYNTGAIGVG